MTTTLGFKDIIDLPLWRPCADSPVASAAGFCLCGDVRNDASCDPHLYSLQGTSTLYSYNPAMDGWLLRPQPGMATFAAGATIVFHPSQGPRGVLAAGNSTTKVVISTALTAAVGINQLSNNGSGARGFRIRIIGNASGSSGKIEEKYIVANTGGTQPTITLDSALSFTPATGDAYELLSGRLFMYGSGTSAGCWRYYDVACNAYSGNLASPATGSTSIAKLVALSELHVPYNRAPSEGFYGNLTATASATGSLTGHSTSGDAGVLANQYRNFQIRIVQDVSIPTAVGQRRRITSHTAGASPVYTLASNWTVTPSATCTYVIENDDDKIILVHDGASSTFNYNITANTWDTTTWASNSATGGGGGPFAQSFGIALGTDLNVDTSRHSHIFHFRNIATLDVFDIAGASTGSWSAAVVYGNAPATLTAAGAGYAYDPVTNQGRYVYMTNVHSNLQLSARFDMKNRVLEHGPRQRYPQGAALTGGNKNAMSFFVDGAVKLGFHHCLHNTSTAHFSMACQR